VEGLEATILRLEDDLRVAKGEAAETLQICEMDKEGMISSRFHGIYLE
jgi:hypothetical protein